MQISNNTQVVGQLLVIRLKRARSGRNGRVLPRAAKAYITIFPIDSNWIADREEGPATYHIRSLPRTHWMKSHFHHPHFNALETYFRHASHHWLSALRQASSHSAIFGIVMFHRSRWMQ